MTRARSLSRLANSNAFTVDASNNVGIGSTIPDVRLDVNGDMNVTGTLTYEDVTNVETAGITTTGGLVVTGLGATIGGITTFFGDLNFGAAGVGGTVTTLGHAEFAGVVTATSFSGDGSALTGVASTENINTSTLAQFTGPVGIADSIFHIGDSNTAIRFPGADTFTVETGGSERFRIHDDGEVEVKSAGAGQTTLSVEANYSASGNVNIQTWARNGAAVKAAMRYVDADTLLKFGTTTNHGFAFITNTNERVRITSAGLVGIGTDNPNTELEIQSATDPKIRLESQESGSKRLDLFIDGGEAVGTIAADQSASQLAFRTAGSEALRIDSSQRLLIGHTSAAENNNMLEVSADHGGRVGFLRSDTTTSAGNNLGMLSFYGNDSNGTYQESARIQVDADLDHGTGDKPGRITFLTSPDGSNTVSERLRIDSSGRVGINSTAASDAELLQVDGSGADTAFIKFKRTDGAGNDTAYGGMTVSDNGGRNIGRAEFRNQDSTTRSQFVISTYTSGSLGVRVRVRGDGAVLPGADASQDLGSSSLRWANIYSADLQLSNEGSSNDVDGTWGQYTIQEGENDLFLLNRRNGKTYKFVLEEVN